jgi:Zn-dependent protease with chaperone function
VNFFQRQQDVRKSSRRLVILFVVAVLAVVGVVDLIAFFLLGLSHQRAAFILDVVLVITGLLILMIGLTSFLRTLYLRNGGGGKVAQSLGGIHVPENTPDPRLRRLRNVVEEMAIASGTPVPEVYILAHENGINAFAAGSPRPTRRSPSPTARWRRSTATSCRASSRTSSATSSTATCG